MTTQYIVRVKDRAGSRLFEITDFLSLAYSKYLNDIGLLTMVLPGNHPAIQYFAKDHQVEVWRFDDTAGIAPYCDFFGLYRARDRSTPGSNINGRFVVKAVDQYHFLRRSIIAYPAGTSGYNDFDGVPAESVMKTMVFTNATSLATVANGRTRDVGGWASYIQVAADFGLGFAITKAFAHMGLLPALQEVSQLGGLDFDLVKIGPRLWEFRTYAQRGQDLTDTVKFSLAWDNLVDPQLVGNDIDEATVAIVGGDGEGSAREFVVVTGPNFTPDYNDIETFVNGVNQGTSLTDAGTIRMREMRARDDFGFGVRQTTGFRYGRDFVIGGVLGDLVPVTYYEAQVVKKIRGAHVGVSAASGSQSNEQITLDLVNLPGG